MATSGTYSFNPDAVDIIGEAFDLADSELRTGYQLRQAVLKLNLLLTEWANEDVNLWTLTEINQLVTAADATYSLSAQYFDVLSVVLRDSNDNDMPLTRLGEHDWQRLGDKTTEGRPSAYKLTKSAEPGTPQVITLWPVPDDEETYRLIINALRHIQDVGSTANTLDVPRRFIPALIYGLAWKISQSPNLRRDGAPLDPAARQLDMARRAELKSEYEMAFMKAREADRERTSLFILPGVAR